jgi:hypothetical protein
MTFGGLLAIGVFVFAVLMMAGVIPLTHVWVGGLIAALCAAVMLGGYPVRWGPAASG